MVVRPETILNPLSSAGLWLAVIITPPSVSRWNTEKYSAGVCTMPTSITSRPAASSSRFIAVWMRGDDSRQSRPSVMRRAPLSAKYAPVARPSSVTKSSGKSASPLPRMSYSRKTLGFIQAPRVASQQIVAPGLLGGLDDPAHILRTVLRDDQDRVARGDHHQIAHAQHAHVRRSFIRHHDAAVAVDQRRAVADDDVTARVGRPQRGQRRPAPHVVPAERARDDAQAA